MGLSTAQGLPWKRAIHQAGRSGREGLCPTPHQLRWSTKALKKKGKKKKKRSEREAGGVAGWEATQCEPTPLRARRCLSSTSSCSITARRGCDSSEPCPQTHTHREGTQPAPRTAGWIPAHRAGDAHSDGHKPTDGSVQPRHGGPSRVRHRPALSPAAAGPAPLPPGSLHPAAQLRGPELHRTARRGPGSATAADIAKSPARSAEPPRPTRTAPPGKPPPTPTEPLFRIRWWRFLEPICFFLTLPPLRAD